MSDPRLGPGWEQTEPEDPQLYPEVGHGRFDVDERSSWEFSTSGADPNHGWNPGFGPSTSLLPLAGRAELSFGGALILGHEGCARPLVLDPTAATLWAALDGTVTVGELAEDLVAALGGSGDHHVDQLLDWARGLAEFGFIDGVEPPVPTRPRRLHPIVDAGSCVGRRMGLGRARMVEVHRGGDAVLRFGSTDHELVDAVAEQVRAPFDVGEGTSAWVQTIVLRRTVGRTARIQQVFEAGGDLLHATRDDGAAVETFRRTIGGLLEQEREAVPGTWFSGPVLIGDGGCCVLHPGVGRRLLDEARSVVERAGLRFAPAGLVRLHREPGGEAEVVLPSGLGGDPEERPVVLRGIMVPVQDRSDPLEQLRSACYAVHHWERGSLQPLADLAHLLRPVPAGLDDEAVVHAARRLLER